MRGADVLPYPPDDPDVVSSAADRARRAAATSARLGDDLAGDAVLLADAWDGPAARGCRDELRCATVLVRSLSDPMQRAAGQLRLHAAVLAAARDEVDALRRDYDSLVETAGRETAALLQDSALPGPLRRLQADELRATHQAGLAAVHVRHRVVLDRVADHARQTGRRVHSAAAAVLPAQVGRRGAVDDGEAALAGLLPLLAAGRRAAGAGGPPPPAGSSPALARAWWASLTSDERDRAIQRWPARVGSADGLPAAVRSAANEHLLAREVAALRARDQLSADEARWLASCLVVRQQLARVRSQRGYRHEAMSAQLLVFDPKAFGGDGRVAIAVGDVDTADNVAFLVPGTGSDVRGSVGRLTGTAVRLTTEARRLMPRATTATVAWMGYDAPGVRDMALAGAAEHGADLLAADVLAVQASRAVAPHLTVVGHSYGSTTAAIGLRDHHTGTDDAVLVGSPGAGVAEAGDLEVPAGHVFAGASSRDPVSYLDRFGTDPTQARFGAVRFRAEDVSRATWHLDLSDHGKYFNPHTESLDNIVHVVTGDYDGVVRAPYRQQVFLLPDGLDDDPETSREATAVP